MKKFSVWYWVFALACFLTALTFAGLIGGAFVDKHLGLWTKILFSIIGVTVAIAVFITGEHMFDPKEGIQGLTKPYTLALVIIGITSVFGTMSTAYSLLSPRPAIETEAGIIERIVQDNKETTQDTNKRIGKINKKTNELVDIASANVEELRALRAGQIKMLKDSESENIEYLIATTQRLPSKVQRKTIETTLEHNSPTRSDLVARLESELSLAYLFRDNGLANDISQKVVSAEPASVFSLAIIALTGEERVSEQAISQIRVLAKLQGNRDARIVSSFVDWLGGDWSRIIDSGSSLDDNIDRIWSELSMLNDPRLFELIILKEAYDGVKARDTNLANRFLRYSQNCNRLSNEVFSTICVSLDVIRYKVTGNNTLFQKKFPHLIERASANGELQLAIELQLYFSLALIQSGAAEYPKAQAYIKKAALDSNILENWKVRAKILEQCATLLHAMESEDKYPYRSYVLEAIKVAPSLEEGINSLYRPLFASYILGEINGENTLDVFNLYKASLSMSRNNNQYGEPNTTVFDVIGFMIIGQEYRRRAKLWLATDYSEEGQKEIELRNLQQVALMLADVDHPKYLQDIPILEGVRLLEAMLLSVLVGDTENADRLLASYKELSGRTDLQCHYCEKSLPPYDIALWHLLLVRFGELEHNRSELVHSKDYSFYALDVLAKRMGPALELPIQDKDLLGSMLLVMSMTYQAYDPDIKIMQKNYDLLVREYLEHREKFR